MAAIEPVPIVRKYARAQGFRIYVQRLPHLVLVESVEQAGHQCLSTS